MKKSLIALAVLAASGAAMAQSSVTLFGIVDTNFSYIDGIGNDNESKYGLGTSGNATSRLGFRGVEDLGGGLKAGFQLESGFNSDTGASAATFFGRQSEVNLSGGFGTVRLGNFFPESYYATADYISMHNHDTGNSSDALYYDPVWFGALGTKNKVGYRSPTFGGLVVDAAVILHEKAAGTSNKNGYDLAANYNLGALALGAGYSGVDSNYQAALRGLYTFGNFTVGAYYQRNKDANQIVASGAGTRDTFRLSGMYAMGASEFHVNVGRAGEYKNINDSDATQYTLGYNYNLSKRTKVYSYYTRINNSRAGTYGLNGATVGAGVDSNTLAVGVRHNF